MVFRTGKHGKVYNTENKGVLYSKVYRKKGSDSWSRLRPHPNYEGKVEEKKVGFVQNPKQVEKYLIAKQNNPKPTKEQNELKRKAFLEQKYNSRITNDRNERNDKKATRKIQSGDYFSPTKCSTCGITFPSKSAYAHHKDNLEDRDGLHISSYAREADRRSRLSPEERANEDRIKRERERKFALAMLLGSVGGDHPDLVRAHGEATKRALGIK